MIYNTTLNIYVCVKFDYIKKMVYSVKFSLTGIVTSSVARKSLKL